MGLKGREDCVIGAQFIQEAVRDDCRIYAFGQAFRRCFIETLQGLIEDTALYLRPYVDILVIDGTQAPYQRLGAEGDGDLCRLIAEAAAGAGVAYRAAAAVLSV